MDVFVYVFEWSFVLIFLGCMSGMGIAESYTGHGLALVATDSLAKQLSQFSLPSVISGSSSHSTCLYLACHPKVHVFDMIGPQTLFDVYLSGSNQESRNHSRCFNKRI